MIQNNEEETNCCNRIQELGCYDILCGRSKKVFNNIGNRRFRVIIELNLQHYLAAKGRAERIKAIDTVYDVLKSEIGARFLKEVSGGDYYIELSTSAARDKIGHAFRDMRTTSRVKAFAQQQSQQSKLPTNLVSMKKRGQMSSTSSLNATAQQHPTNITIEDLETKTRSEVLHADPLESKPFEFLSLPANQVDSIGFNGRYSFIHSNTNTQQHQTSFLLDSGDDDDVLYQEKKGRL